MIQEVILILIVLGLLVYWWDTTRTNEVAIRACRNICESQGVQLLDATVSRQRLWLRRHPSGGVQICRLYSFEYSHNNEDREFGYLVLLGQQVAESRIGSASTFESGPGPGPGPDSQIH